MELDFSKFDLIRDGVIPASVGLIVGVVIGSLHEQHFSNTNPAKSILHQQEQDSIFFGGIITAIVSALAWNIGRTVANHTDAITSLIQNFQIK